MSLRAVMKRNFNHPFWCWLASQRDFSVSLVMRWGFSRADAEDIFAELSSRWSREEEAFPLIESRALLVSRLRWTKEDFRKKWTSERRGGGIEFVSIDNLINLACEVDPWEASFRRQAALPMFDRLEARVRGRKRILVRVMRRVIASGDIIRFWHEAFTDEERRDFMGKADLPGPEGDRCFAKQVSRTASEIYALIRGITGSN